MTEALPGGMRTVKDVLALSAAFLNAKGIATARLDAERLIGPRLYRSCAKKPLEIMLLHMTSE